MRRIYKFAVTASAGLVSLIGSTPVSAQMSAEEQDYIHREMAEFVFIPIEEMEFGGRDVRRVLLRDPYMMLPIPGLELERHRDGRRTLRIRHYGWNGQTFDLSQEEWDTMSALEDAAFAPPGENKNKIKKGVVVHCWGGMLERTPRQATSWWGCNSGTKNAQSYTEALVRLANEKNGCKLEEDSDVFFQYSRCFADRGGLSNPEEDARLTNIIQRWRTQREPGSSILADARRALTAAEKQPTYANFEVAQRAVADFGDQQDSLRQIIQALGSSFPSLEPRDARTSKILENLRRQWTSDVNGQYPNYIGLLERLMSIQSQLLEMKKQQI